MFRAGLLALVLLAFGAGGAKAVSYLDEVASETYAGVYAALGITLPEKVAHDPQVWLTLDQLKREPCDQKSITDLAVLLDQLSYRRQAAVAPYNFVKRCGAPVNALHKAVDTLLKLSDYPMALEVADEFVRRAPTNLNAHYLRGEAFEDNGDYNRALADYADTIELFNDKTKVSLRVFQHMAESYAKLGRQCEAMSPILTWMALDPVMRDTSKTRKIVDDYERQGNCATTTGSQKERYPLRGATRVVLAKGEINGVRGTFIIDTGASYVSVRAAFAERAKISTAGARDITLSTANGRAKGKLTQADAVGLGRLKASHVPVVVQDVDEKSYGQGVDGLLGMSFLSRFEVQMSGGYVEIKTRARK